MPSLPPIRPLDLRRARIAKKRGMQNSLRIIIEARRAGLPISLAFAVIEQESTTGANVWGHDKEPNGLTSHLGGKLVTPSVYRRYRGTRGPKGQGGMQGVGPAQLTWYGLQDKADALGGCWIPKHNIRVAFTHLADLIDLHSDIIDGLAAYNGTVRKAQDYAKAVRTKQNLWHLRLTR